jgi:putative membrane protein
VSVPPRGGYAGIFLRGMLMGAADVVPGVSGGTMAFITGIYDRLLGAISAVDLAWLRLLFRGRLRAAFEAVDGLFLLTLLAGIATSVATLAHLITWLLAQYPVLLWSFFFGLIAGSAVVLVRHVRGWTAPVATALLAGAAAAAAIALSPAVSLDGGMPGLFVAGFLAICAMILPGVSGSFILVLLGMYSTVLGAVSSFDVAALGVFAAGAASGLLLFARLLHWLLARYHQPCMALLTGFLAGSLLTVWPWKLPRGSAADAPLWPAAPWDYAAANGTDAVVLPAALLMLLGLALVWLIERRWGGVED